MVHLVWFYHADKQTDTQRESNIDAAKRFTVNTVVGVSNY